jgi:hypothetical protein
MTTRRSSAATARTRAGKAKIEACAALLLCIVLADASQAAAASTSTAGDPAACREIQSSMERLDCYARAVDASRRSSSGREEPRYDAAAATATTTPVADAIDDRAEQEAGEPTAVEPAAVAPAIRARETAAAPAVVTTKIAEVRETSIGRQRYVLDNGDVWEQAEFRSASTLKQGDEVVLQESMFGSQHLRPADGRGSSVKVRRLQ